MNEDHPNTPNNTVIDDHNTTNDTNDTNVDTDSFVSRITFFNNVFSPTVRRPIRPIHSLWNDIPDIPSNNIYFNFYKTLKHEIEDSSFCIDDVSLPPIASIDDEKWKPLVSEIVQFKQILNNSRNEYVKSLDDYKTIKNKYEKHLELIRSLVKIIDDDYEDKETDLASRFKEMIDEYISEKYKNDVLMDHAHIVRENKKKLLQLVKLSTNITNIQPLPICAICLNSFSDVVFVSCGHTCCLECSNLLYNCHVCRKRIFQKQKLYY